MPVAVLWWLFQYQPGIGPPVEVFVKPPQLRITVEAMPTVSVKPPLTTIGVIVSSPNNTQPNAAVQYVRATLPYNFDFSQALAAGDTITGFSSVMNDTTSGGSTPVTLPDAPTQSGSVITQIVRGSSLTAGHTYRLEVAVTVTANVKVIDAAYDITCPF